MKNKGLVVFICILLLFITGCDIKVKPINNEEEVFVELKELGYSKEELDMLKNKLTIDNLNILSEFDYINNINDLIDDNSFNIDLFKDYLKSYSTTNNIKHSMIIVNNNINYAYNEKLIKMLDNENFKISNIDRYYNYENIDNITIDEIISYVNCNLDYNFYEHDIDADISLNELMLVNKYYKLSSEYKNSNLVKMSLYYSKFRNNYMDKEAYSNFVKMVQDAKKDKLNIIAINAYQDYKHIENNYNDYLSNNIEDIDMIIAKAGYSEFQTGYSLDITKKGKALDDFKDTLEYEWIINNSYKYGFILRYPKDKEKYTGFKENSNQIRYVGIDASSYIHDNNLSFEEYYSMKIEK